MTASLTPKDRTGALSFMLAPFPIEEFFHKHLERAPLHIERNHPGYFGDVYGIGDVEDALVVGAREPELFALVKTGSPEPSAQEFTYERPSVRWRFTGKASQLWLDARKVFAYYAEGYTLIVKDAASFSARLQRFCNRLQRDLAAYAQPNVYLTPPAAQGFEVHHDTHDTLTAQIEGEKTWRIYEPIVPLPLESQPFHSGTKVQGLKLVREVHLRPGDTLYIPRGFPHEARTSSTTSLHCTFALVPIRITDVLDIVIRIAGDRDVELREGLTPDMLDSDQLAPKLSELYAKRLGAALASDRVALAVEIALNELFKVTRPNTDGAFAQTLKASKISPDTRVQLDETIPFRVREHDGVVDLVIAGKVVVFPGECAPALAALQRGPTTVAGMDPALNASYQYALIKRLVIEGLAILD
jgi:bifunctional lysine-specific demethylase and histidyl-hydroxylase NO66